jgi:hypothetical protein
MWQQKHQNLPNWNGRGLMKRLTNRSSQPLAVPMSSFCMTSTLKWVAKLAPASGG